MNTESKIQMGKMPDSWQEGTAKTITFSVTEACNLACTYCYMTGKNTKNKMSFETAKKSIDYISLNKELFREKSVIWDFVGGEPLLEIDLIDRISDYIKHSMYILEHPWFNIYRFSLSTNGLLYDTPKVQKYIEKNKHHLSIGMSVDGNKIKHDLARIKPDGSGSYEDVIRNVPLWLKQFPGASTKATFSHDDLPYLKDSIISLWENGIKMVSANVVFEDVWQEGDDIIFETQLRELGDYILENRLWEEYSVRFFDPHIGFPLSKRDMENNYCEAGKMLAIDYKGRYFPCIRFLDFSLNNQPGLCIGGIDNGIATDKLRPFQALTLKSQSMEECINCQVASGCSWCTGNNYDMSDTGTVYQRATFLCKMHRANVSANMYFWDKFEKVTGLPSQRKEYFKNRFRSEADKISDMKYLQFIISDNITPHCTYRNWRNTQNSMSYEMIEKGLKFAEDNGFVPVFLGTVGEESINSFSIVDSKSAIIPEDAVAVYDNQVTTQSGAIRNCVLLISRSNIVKLSNLITHLYPSSGRINVILEDIEKWDSNDIEAYKEQLGELSNFILTTYKKKSPLEVNVLTDILNLETLCDCDAGDKTFSLAPNGKIYMCPAFYFDNADNYIGDLDNGIQVNNAQLLELENAPICSVCDAFHCRRCKFLNKKMTNEINTPSKIQCTISHIERNKSMELQRELIRKNLIAAENVLEEIEYLDPLDKLLKRSVVNV